MKYVNLKMLCLVVLALGMAQCSNNDEQIELNESLSEQNSVEPVQDTKGLILLSPVAPPKQKNNNEPTASQRNENSQETHPCTDQDKNCNGIADDQEINSTNIRTLNFSIEDELQEQEIDKDEIKDTDI